MTTTQIKYELNNNAERYVRERSMKIMLELVEELDINPAEAYYCEETSNSEINETYYIVQVTKSGSRVAAKIEDYDGYAENNVVQYSEDLVDDIELQLALISGCKKMLRIKPIYNNGYYLDVADISNSMDIKKITINGKEVTQLCKIDINDIEGREEKYTDYMSIVLQIETYLYNTYGLAKSLFLGLEEWCERTNGTKYEPLKNGDIIYIDNELLDNHITELNEDDDELSGMKSLHNLLANV